MKDELRRKVGELELEVLEISKDKLIMQTFISTIKDFLPNQ